MAKLRKNELKSMGPAQLKEKLEELRKELMKINAQIAVGTNPQSPGQAKALKKTIARIHTYNHQKKQEGGQKKKTTSNE